MNTLLLDISSDTSISSAISHLSSACPRLDVLIQNAGVATPVFKKDTVKMFTKTEGTSLDDLIEIFKTGVAGVVELTNGVLPLMKESGTARIVNGEINTRAEEIHGNSRFPVLMLLLSL